MTELIQRPGGHPMVAVLEAALAAVEDVFEVPEWSMDADATAAVLPRLTALKNKVAALELRHLAHAEQVGVAAEAGATSTANWFAHATRTNRSEAHAAVRLAAALGRDRPVRRALWDGRLLPAQAQVIVQTIGELPDVLEAAEIEKVEAHLVDLAADHDAKALRILGRHAVEVVDPDLADAHEGRLLAEQERAAEAKAWFTGADDGHGSFRFRGQLPSLQGAMLRKALRCLLKAEDHGRPGPERMGQAFSEYVERYPVDQLPTRGGVNATVVVTMGLETLLGGLKAARLDTGETISAGQARRLACEAGIIPAVLGGRSVVLDLGRKRRFFTEHQRIAAALTQQTCAVEGCDHPPGMLHAHHREEWSRGGRSDLADLVLICPFHHHQLHRGASLPMRT